MPAKLLIDNRIVINNHLKRGRGGKVSFTHLIGYAIIRAMQAMPEMNSSYAEVDGKPTLVKPEHVNFGLAIDLKKDDGQRQLVVPNLKAAETLDFRQFWAAYEEVVRKARNEQADDRRLRRYHDQPDQPGHHRDGPLGSAAHARPGHDHRRRRDGVPRRVRRHLVRGPRTARHQQGHDAHVDL